jgi:hypothetical protein
MNKIDFSVKRVNLAVVIISALILLIVFNLPFKVNPLGDYTFHNESKNLALFIKGKVAFDKVVVTRAPGPILFYTPVYLLAPADASDDQLWVYGVSFTSIIITLSLLLIFRIGTAFFSKEVGLLGVLLFFSFPIHSYYSLAIAAEIPAFFSLTLAIYGWSIAVAEPHKKRGWILLVIGMWWFILNRPNTMLLLGVLFLVIVYSFFRDKTFFEKYGKKLGLTFLSVFILGLGVLELAKLMTGSKTAENQESLFYHVALQGRYQFREEPTDFRFWDSDNRPDSKDYQNWNKKGEELGGIIAKTHRPYNEVYRDFIIDDAIAHPFWFTRQFFVKCLYGHITIISKVQPNQFHLGPFRGSLGFWAVLFIINSINLLVLVGAGIFLFTEKKLLHYWIFWGVTVALLLFHGLTYMEPRYIFPSKVGLYLMSAAGLYRIGWIKKLTNAIAFYLFPTPKPE